MKIDITKPNETLTIKGNAYTLKSVIVHLGATPHSGHYITYIKNIAGNWWVCNDETCRPRKRKRSIFQATEKVYVLMYEQS